MFVPYHHINKSLLLGFTSLVWSFEFYDLAAFCCRKSLILKVRRSHDDVLDLHCPTGQSFRLWRALQYFSFRVKHCFILGQCLLCLDAIDLLLLEGLQIYLQIASHLTDWRC